MDPATQTEPQQGPPPGVTFGAPVAPSVALATGAPPGVTFGAPAQIPARPAVDPLGLTDNAKGEGVYKMDVPNSSGGTAPIPYSNVARAMAAGYGISDPVDQQRFMKDRAADPNTSTMHDLIDVLVKQPWHGLKQSAKGLLKNEAQVPLTVADWLDKGETHLNRMDEIVSGRSNKTPADLVTGNNPNVTHVGREAVKAFLEEHAPGITTAPIGASQERGAMVGSIGEFATGEAGLEGMTGLEKLSKSLPWLVEGGNYAEKVKAAEPILKVAAAHPRIAATLIAGLQSGTVGTAQAALHGASPTEALEAGAAAAGTAAAVRGAGEGFANAREAAVGRETAAAAHEGAPVVQAERTAAMTAERQVTAQGQVKDVAQQATQDALDRLNAARTPQTVTTPGASVPARAGADSIDEGIRAQNARRELGSMANTIPDRLLPRNPIVEEIGPRAALVPNRVWDEVGNPAPLETTEAPNFEPVDSAAHAGQVNSFGSAAETVRAAADPVYKKIDTATGGQFAKLQKARAAGFAVKDYAKVAQSDDAIDELLRSKPKDVSPEDYAAAKSAWRDSKVLDRLHSATEGAFNGISEEMAAQPGTGPRLLRGGDSQAGSLQKRIGSLLKNPKDAADVKRVIGDEGVANLYRASHLVSTPELRAQTQQIAEAVAKEFPAPAKPHPVAQALKDSVIGAGTGAVLNYATGGHLPAGMSEAAGAGLANGTRFVLRKMVMSPAVGKAMEYAVRNKVTPQLAGAMVAAIIRKEQPEQEEQAQP